MARRPIVAANWKMHKTHLEAIRDVQKLSYLLDRDDADRVEVVICPPFTALRAVQTLIESDRLAFGLGAQNANAEAQGAFTGEVSVPMLAAALPEERVNKQVRAAFTGVGEEDGARPVLAYEPIWAIGPGGNADPANA